ncbi:hypothetical protein J2Y02_001001 [Neobacillus drentensis]|nr:hypothetical protein [Neobacillus drentensis]
MISLLLMEWKYLREQTNETTRTSDNGFKILNNKWEK